VDESERGKWEQTVDVLDRLGVDDG